ATDHQTQTRKDLLFEPRLVEPHGRQAFVARVDEAGAQHVKPAPAARRGAAQHAAGDGGHSAVFEGREVGQQAPVLVAPGEVEQQIAVGLEADLGQLPGSVGAQVEEPGSDALVEVGRIEAAAAGRCRGRRTDLQSWRCHVLSVLKAPYWRRSPVVLPSGLSSRGRASAAERSVKAHRPRLLAFDSLPSLCFGITLRRKYELAQLIRQYIQGVVS